MPPARNESPEQRERRLARQRERQRRYQERKQAESPRRSSDGGGRLLGIGLLAQPGAPASIPRFEFFANGSGHLPSPNYEQWLDAKDAAKAASPDPGPATVVTPSGRYVFDPLDSEDIARCADLVADDLGYPANACREALSKVEAGRTLTLVDETP
jgi:hypothetical protein